MMVFNSEDIFSADRYPEMANELKILKDAAAQMPVYFKGEIVISYLKKHFNSGPQKKILAVF